MMSHIYLLKERCMIGYLALSVNSLPEGESISETVIGILTSAQIGGFENTQIFPGEENLLGFRRRLSFPLRERNHARLRPTNGFLHHTT